jgi:GGDEF domain-containing protein
MSLIQKLIVSYATMAFFTMAALVSAIVGLYALNRTARDIAHRDLTTISSLTRLRASLLAQEGFAGRYAILKSAEFSDLFHQREKEVLAILRGMQQDRSSDGANPLSRMYRNYQNEAARLFGGETTDTAPMRTSAARLLKTVDTLYDTRQRELQEKLAAASDRERMTIRWTLLLSFTGFFLAVLVAAVFIFRISTAIRKLKRATHRIAEGDFDHVPQIPAGDEFGDLARDFVSMAARLKVLEQMSLDASPLTRLPGNIAIERVLERRLHNEEHFAVCYADLDNFKAFNDRYGYVKGSDLIKATAEIIYETVKALADSDAFVGHVGGDDFVMVVAADKVTAVCEGVIDRFNPTVIAFYDDEDRDRGGIDGVDRYGVPRFFPLMTISIAVIICSRGDFDSAVEIARSAAEIKDYVKEKPGSSYFISRRKHPR